MHASFTNPSRPYVSDLRVLPIISSLFDHLQDRHVRLQSSQKYRSSPKRVNRAPCLALAREVSYSGSVLCGGGTLQCQFNRKSPYQRGCVTTRMKTRSKMRSCEGSVGQKGSERRLFSLRRRSTGTVIFYHVHARRLQVTSPFFNKVKRNTNLSRRVPHQC
jgi:hypothetical protein